MQREKLQWLSRATFAIRPAKLYYIYLHSLAPFSVPPSNTPEIAWRPLQRIAIWHETSSQNGSRRDPRNAILPNPGCPALVNRALRAGESGLVNRAPLAGESGAARWRIWRLDRKAAGEDSGHIHPETTRNPPGIHPDMVAVALASLRLRPQIVTHFCSQVQ